MCIQKIDSNQDEKRWIEKYQYQKELTARLDNLENTTFTQEIINEIALWKVNRYSSTSRDLCFQW
mgnify:CR=1 FL=1